MLGNLGISILKFKARVNSHHRWKQTRFRVCFHLWCELTTTMNITEWQVSWNSWNGSQVSMRDGYIYQSKDTCSIFWKPMRKQMGRWDGFYQICDPSKYKMFWELYHEFMSYMFNLYIRLLHTKKRRLFCIYGNRFHVAKTKYGFYAVMKIRCKGTWTNLHMNATWFAYVN